MDVILKFIDAFARLIDTPYIHEALSMLFGLLASWSLTWGAKRGTLEWIVWRRGVPPIEAESIIDLPDFMWRLFAFLVGFLSTAAVWPESPVMPPEVPGLIVGAGSPAIWWAVWRTLRAKYPTLRRRVKGY